MKKWIAVSMCAALLLALLAGCQGNTDVPYVTGPDAQGGQSQPGTTTPQGGQSQAGTTVPQGDQPSGTTPAGSATQPSQNGGQEDDPDGPIVWPTQGQQDSQRNDQTTPTTDPADFVLPTPEECTYEQYQAMTGEQQEAFFNQFNGDFDAFFAWLEAAQAESEANSDDIVLDPDATIDWDDIFGKEE